MQIEFEATFVKIDKNQIRQKLETLGAKLVKPEFLQKRKVFFPPSHLDKSNTWLRVRDEQDKITLSLKSIQGNKITDQKELELKVDNFEQACELLTMLGCRAKAYQETLRELWHLNGCEVTLDEWPFLEPIVEIEGASAELVQKTAELLGFDYTEAKFCSAAQLYADKYGFPKSRVNEETPLLTFEMKNPFV